MPAETAFRMRETGLQKRNLKCCTAECWFGLIPTLKTALQIDVHCVMKAIRKLRRKTESKTSVPRVTR